MIAHSDNRLGVKEMLIVNVPPQPRIKKLKGIYCVRVRSDKCLEFYHGEYAQSEWMVLCDTQTRHLSCLHFHCTQPLNQLTMARETNHLKNISMEYIHSSS
jgi:hypothetical protein